MKNIDALEQLKNTLEFVEMISYNQDNEMTYQVKTYNGETRRLNRKDYLEHVLEAVIDDLTHVVDIMEERGN